MESFYKVPISTDVVLLPLNSSTKGKSIRFSSLTTNVLTTQIYVYTLNFSTHFSRYSVVTCHRFMSGSGLLNLETSTPGIKQVQRLWDRTIDMICLRIK